MSREPAPFRRVAIVGLGLIGGSIALAIKRRSPASRVIAIDRPHVLDLVMARGAADVASDAIEIVHDADLVILAAPVMDNIALLPRLSAHLATKTLVTDVGSTKRAIVAAADATPSLRFIGGHPMSGAAAGGFPAARHDLFDGRPWILTPHPEPAETVDRLDRFVAGLGAVPHIMAADLHDRLVGAVSHLPQLTASALMHVVGKLAGDAGLELAGAGLMDATRLAGSPPAIWRDIAATNEDVLREALDVMIRTLTQMRESLGTGETIDAVFTSAARWRDVLVRARGE